MFSNLAIRRPVATAMLTLMVAVVGISSLIGIPQDLFPRIQYPAAIVLTSYPNASPEEVENLVTKPLERVLASVENMDQIYSVTMQGQSIVMIEFRMDTDMNFATLNMRERIALVTRALPKDAGDPMVIKMDMNAMPIMQVYASGDMPMHQLNNEIENNVLTYFERTKGVASVRVTGSVSEEITLAFNPEKLTGYGINLAQISQILAAENINLPSGDVTKGSTEVIVRTIGEFKSVDDIKDLPVALMDRSIVRLADIATVTQGYADTDSITRIDGRTAIGIMITKQSDANTIEVSKSINKVIGSLHETFPDIHFSVGFDQADYIQNSLNSVARAAILGGLLAMLVVFLFLRNFRTTLVIAISIPVSLLATFALMDLRGITLNLVTLCALALAVGMLVDDSIVVLENIFRTRQFVDDPYEAARRGSREIFLAVAASTLTTVLVFLPIAMSSGIAALMFSDFCFTIVIALLVSLVVSLSAVPMLCSKLLSSGISLDYVRFGSRRYKFRVIQRFSQFIEFLTIKYESMMRPVLKMRKRVVATCILIFLASVGLVSVVGTELLPATDEASFTVSVDMPYGTPLSEKDAFLTEIEEYVLAIPETTHCTLNIGGGMNLMSVGGNSSSLNVSLVPMAERDRSTADIVDEVKEKTLRMTGADISVNASSSMGMMLGSVDMSVMVKGPDLKTLEKIAFELRDEIAEHPDVTEAVVDITEGNPEIRVVIDRNTAAYYGITAYQLANGLSSALSGTTATTLKIAGNEIDVTLSLPETYKQSVDNMKQIMITGGAGVSVPVGQIAAFEYGNSPDMISRLNQQRFVTVDISFDSSDLAASAASITSLANNYNFPDGYYFETMGMQEEMMNAFSSLFKALLISVALVYLLLAAQFESLVLPFIVATSIPFAMSGAFLALFITDTKLSMTSFLGLIMLVGIVVNNAILLVEFITQNKKLMGRDEALVQAGKVRLRPILMTMMTTIVGMIPISLGLGEGTEMLAPMGIAIIGGLLTSTVVTLVFVPVLYSIIDDGKTKRLQKKDRKHERVAALEAKWLKEDAQNV
ncbi:MAG: efflux RND transporter permease subunit [Clostridiales bacterium]|nr:efflux RND transporter permease subunit [Clostridiales bacterium]